ncbi:MAG TPA: HNH endonuclease signature motif containing protein, partial [Woeseiaceae bacterium]|nr:HNH endonuclease signature motif containing protein [Woeseiaceae bacterium]
KRALWARDKGCRFPGCHHKRFVDAHHIEHWSAGGETSLPNLMLICTQHHLLLHEGGFRIEKDYRDRWFFKRPDGRAVPACGYRAVDMTDDDVDVAGEYFHTHTSGEGCGNPSAEGFLNRFRNPAAVPDPAITAGRGGP